MKRIINYFIKEIKIIFKQEMRYQARKKIRKEYKKIWNKIKK